MGCLRVLVSLAPFFLSVLLLNLTMFAPGHSRECMAQCPVCASSMRVGLRISSDSFVGWASTALGGLFFLGDLPAGVRWSGGQLFTCGIFLARNGDPGLRTFAGFSAVSQ